MQLKGRDRASASVLQAIRTGALVEFASGSVLVTRGGDLSVRSAVRVSPVRDHSGQIIGAALLFSAARKESNARRLRSTRCRPGSDPAASR